MRRRIVVQIAAIFIAGLGFSAPARSLTCAPGPFILFFDPGRADIDGKGIEILDFAIEAAGSCGSWRAMVDGFTDTRENPKVARRRAEAVRAYFVRHGVRRSDIVLRAFGAGQQRIATGRNVSERQNRRVLISFGPR